MTCPICGKASAGACELCEDHEFARKNLVGAYERWRTAYGGIEWADYLHRILELEGSGQWARDAAKYLIQKG